MHESFQGEQFGITVQEVTSRPRSGPGAVDWQERVPEHPRLSRYVRPVNGGDQLPAFTPHSYDYYDDSHQEVDPEQAARITRWQSSSPVLSSTARYGSFTLRHAENDDGTLSVRATRDGSHITDGMMETHIEADPVRGARHAPAMIMVDSGSRRQGLARAMFRYGQMFSGGDLVHSQNRTPDGYGYSGRVPDDPTQDPTRRVRPVIDHPTLF